MFWGNWDVGKRILLVDGSNLLFQMFFGMPARIVNEEGRAIQGVLGFVGALLKILHMVNPTCGAVFFDGETENPRIGLEPDYKANRPDFSLAPEEENPYSQLDGVYAALDFLGLRHWETEDCETDDVISAYALRYGREAEVVISSFDSDFFQLITEQISVLRYRGKATTLCTPAWVREKFGVPPERYADWKALVGDRSDNIKGADQVGPKTAAALLKEFGSLENILSHGGEIKKPFVRDAVLRDKKRLERNYTLIKLDGEGPMPFSLEELRYEVPEYTTMQVLKGIGLKHK